MAKKKKNTGKETNINPKGLPNNISHTGFQIGLGSKQAGERKLPDQINRLSLLLRPNLQYKMTDSTAEEPIPSHQQTDPSGGEGSQYRGGRATQNTQSALAQHSEE